jgi:hypothetical protein
MRSPGVSFFAGDRGSQLRARRRNRRALRALVAKLPRGELATAMPTQLVGTCVLAQ